MTVHRAHLPTLALAAILVLVVLGCTEQSTIEESPPPPLEGDSIRVADEPCDGSADIDFESRGKHGYTDTIVEGCLIADGALAFTDDDGTVFAQSTYCNLCDTDRFLLGHGGTERQGALTGYDERGTLMMWNCRFSEGGATRFQRSIVRIPPGRRYTNISVAGTVSPDWTDEVLQVEYTGARPWTSDDTDVAYFERQVELTCLELGLFETDSSELALSLNYVPIGPNEGTPLRFVFEDVVRANVDPGAP